MKFCCSSGGDFLYYSHRRPQKSLTIDLDGMNVPIYKSVPRAACRMLTFAWERRWDELVARCHSKPEEAFTKTEHSGRTALHLATFNEGCPSHIATALLRANRHAILVEDYHCYTPLHNLGFFEGGDKVMSLFCDTAIMVEQELQGRGTLPTPSRTSPLYLAAKRDAPTETLRILLQTRTRSCSLTSNHWMAPITGGEPYWDPQQTLDKCSSPLEILLRGRASCLDGICNDTQQQMAAMALEFLGGRGSDSHSDMGDKDETDNEQTSIPGNQHDQSALVMWEKCLLFLAENVRTTTTTTSISNNSHDCEDDTPQLQLQIVPSLLHTVASLKVPVPVLLQVAVQLFPEQVIQCDDTGRCPLYHILKANHPYATQQLLRILLLRPQQPQSKRANDEDNGNDTPPLTILSHPLPQIQECLALALEIGLAWKDGLEDIVMADSDVLRVQDPATRLVPAFLAAHEKTPLDTIFLLLLAEPQVVWYRHDMR